MDNRFGHWNAQHELLRRLLLQDKDHGRALPILLDHRAAVHNRRLEAGACVRDSNAYEVAASRLEWLRDGWKKDSPQQR